MQYAPMATKPVTNDAYADFDIATAIHTYGDRLQDFFTLKKFFNTDADATAFYGAVCMAADAGMPHYETLEHLRKAFRAYQQDVRFSRNTKAVTAYLADDMYDLLAGAPRQYPSGGDRPADLLDIGCGSGIITSTLAERFYLSADRAIGLDLFVPDHMPEHARIRRIQKDDVIGAIGLAQFDIVVISMVLHHSAHPERLLRQAWQATRPGGYLLLKEHNAPMGIHGFLDAIHYFHEQIFQDQVYYKPNERNYHTLAEWQQMAERIGFKAEAVDYKGYYERPANTNNNFTLLLQKVG